MNNNILINTYDKDLNHLSLNSGNHKKTDKWSQKAFTDILENVFQSHRRLHPSPSGYHDDLKTINVLYEH